jgi:hypothetical protein
MPGFWRKNNRYFVSYITGPSHVLLGLSFGPVGVEPALVRLSRSDSCDHGPLEESRIRDAVMAGVAAAGVQLHPAEIIYCEGDSPRYELYQHCGCVLARQVASGADFPESHDTAA